jgi:type I restriction enzyme S subunit
VIRRWREIERWIEDEEAKYTGAFSECPLSDFIARKVSAINRDERPLDDLNVIAKITFGGELHIRSTEEKRGYKGPLFEALPGDLVISKIRVAQGSLCVVPDDIDHLAVSAEYPVYTVDHTKVHAEFVRLVVRTAAFQRRVSRLRSGNTTKARIRPAQFEALHIPVPVLHEQNALIATYTEALARATKLEQEAEALEHAGWQAFEAALGAAPPVPLPDRPVFVARFKDVERWSHEGVLRASVGDHGVRVATCPIAELGTAAAISYGLQKSPANRPGTHARPYLRVANVQRGRLVLDEVKTINVPDADMPNLRLEVGDILFVEGNGSRAELGRVALWNGEIADCVHQNHIIKARPQRSHLLPEFAMAWFNSDAGRDHFFKSGKTTSGLGTINSTVIRTAPIPLPSLSVQKSLIAELSTSEVKANAKRTEAATLRQSAWATFEAALFTATEETPECS